MEQSVGTMKTVVVTGGAGFLGSHIVRRLVRQSHVEKVIVLDSFLTGCRDNLIDDPKVKVIEQDVLDVKPTTFGKVHEIYHLACPASPIHYEKNPIHTTMSAVIGTKNMLDVATKYDAKILVTSTSEVYGDPEVSPQPETYNGNVPINGPRSCYDEGKRCGESLCFDYWRMHKTKIKIARLFNTYGPHMLEDDGRVISNFIVQSLKGLALTIYGTGEQTRSFCYVDDTIDALLMLMDTDYHVLGPINIGNPDEYSIKRMAEIIATTIGGGQVRLVHNPLPIDDPQQRRPDITEAKNRLGWYPKVSLDEGLGKTIDFFRRRFNNG